MRLRGFYVLAPGNIPVPEPDMLAWGKWFMQPSKRRVGKTMIGDVEVSTVFTGQSLTDPPEVFETMIFNGALDKRQFRYATWEDAEEGHRAAVVIVEAAEAQQRDKFAKEFLR